MTCWCPGCLTVSPCWAFKPSLVIRYQSTYVQGSRQKPCWRGCEGRKVVTCIGGLPWAEGSPPSQLPLALVEPICQPRAAIFHSVQFSCSVVSNFLWLHELQHTRLPCPSPTPRAYSSSRPYWWCHPTISPSVIPFSSCLHSFPASGSFPMNQFFTSGDQSIGISPSASVLPMNIQDWFTLWWTGWISLQSKALSRLWYSPTPQFKSIDSLVLSFLYSPTLTSIHDHRKNHSLD